MADKDEKKKGGGKAWIGALALCTLVAIGTGGGLGMYLMSSVEKAVDQKTREAQEHENMRVAMLTKALGDFCHLNIEYHARTLAKFVEADAAIRELQVTPSEIEDDVGLMESRAASANCNLYQKMVGALEDKQLTVKEEEKERKKIGEMFFDGADPLFEEA